MSTDDTSKDRSGTNGGEPPSDAPAAEAVKAAEEKKLTPEEAMQKPSRTSAKSCTIQSASPHSPPNSRTVEEAREEGCRTQSQTRAAKALLQGAAADRSTTSSARSRLRRRKIRSRNGVRLVEKQLLGALERSSVTLLLRGGQALRSGAARRHSASGERETCAPGSVAQEFASWLHAQRARLLRAAMVAVTKAAAKPEDGGETKARRLMAS